MDEKRNKVVDQLVALLESILETHIEYEDKLPELKKLYGEEVFRDNCQIVTLSLPRRAGHTTAALELLHRYSRAILVQRTNNVPKLRIQDPVISSQIMSIEEACLPHTSHVLRILGTLGNIDFILLDSGTVKRTDVDMLFSLYSPRIVVVLGDSKIDQDQ